MVQRKTITVALAGNPNSGKTTIFNNLTGSHQHVGNYGGVTVETKEGILHSDGYTIRVIDLPGTYSLTAYSIEEVVAQNYILQERPDVVVDVVDGTNLERNLYLPIQLAELGVPLILAVNMADEMAKHGIAVDAEMLSASFGAQVVKTIGTRNKGTDKLVAAIVEVATSEGKGEGAVRVNYGGELETEIEKIAGLVQGYNEEVDGAAGLDERVAVGALNARWAAIKLLENDREVMKAIHLPGHRKGILEQVGLSRSHLTGIFGDDPEVLVAERRYGHIHGLCRAAIRETALARVNASDKIDRVLTNRILGLPIFAVLLYVVFWAVFSLGSYPMDWIERGIGGLSGVLEANWPADHWEFMRSLVLDGVIAGVGGVIVFLPNIMLLFLALALLEDTGYMARAAFIMDRLMKWVGLHGKSFIPMLTGFGCSVPGILATRILDNKRDRITTILVLPLMSCGARLPIYMLIIPAFFPVEQRSVVMYSIYVIGIVLAVVLAKLLRGTVFKGVASPFVMELPPYRMPTVRAILLHMWQRSWLYLRKAGTVILAISVVMWAITSFPKPSASAVAELEEQTREEALAANPAITEAQLAAVAPSEGELARLELDSSLGAKIGRKLEVVFRPLGFDWRINTALIGAFAAKEVFVAQMGIVFSLGEVELGVKQGHESGRARLGAKLRETYTPLVGFCVMLFCLISTPCMATIAVTKREIGWRWALLQLGGLTVLAYLLTLAVYQVGSALQIGTGVGFGL